MEECPDKLDNVEFVTVRDNYKAGASGSQIDGKPKAWIAAIKLLDHWKYDDVDLVDQQTGAQMHPRHRLSPVDFVTLLMTFHESIIPGEKSGITMDVPYTETLRTTLKSPRHAHQPWIRHQPHRDRHGTYMDLPDGTTKIFPQGVGQKLSPKSQYFSIYIRYKKQRREAEQSKQLPTP